MYFTYYIMKRRRLWSPLIFTALISFIMGALFSDYYIHDRISIIKSVNASDLIEQALEYVPLCTPHDRARHRSLLTTLQMWDRVAHQHNIQYWIIYGTLVGYVQRHGLLPHDLDIDILMIGEHTSQLVTLANSTSPGFNTSQYQLKVHPQWSIVGHSNRSYFYSKGINFVAPNARFVEKNTGRHVDIYPVYYYYPDEWKNSTNNDTAMLISYGLSYNWTSLPMNWTFPLRMCEFSFLKVWCPAQPEKIVASIYGLPSVSLSRKVCINGEWTNSKDYMFAVKTLRKS